MHAPVFIPLEYRVQLPIPNLETVPPGFKNGMNFGSSDVNLNLASSLKQLKSKPNDQEDSKLIVESDSTSVIDLADLLKFFK
ncbi:hypothetical protein DAPPUDRAFT_256475 [Daphnia pulex]|uniref:Uncharacterized protein n=1 Tax=Daphnia pulex TaxID=6669 RepID=E9HBF9_DAPPU|nr:hypothetical protein DAPPUDRAFT_256475 [Daphnia pulex]|eukprot:EFX70834.1 hypothetical protein DAPPUDRAFT_256475 [Daphnia pulex]